MYYFLNDFISRAARKKHPNAKKTTATTGYPPHKLSETLCRATLLEINRPEIKTLKLILRPLISSWPLISLRSGDLISKAKSLLLNFLNIHRSWRGNTLNNAARSLVIHKNSLLIL